MYCLFIYRSTTTEATDTAPEEEAITVSAPIPTVEITTGSFFIGNQEIEVGK